MISKFEIGFISTQAANMDTQIPALTIIINAQKLWFGTVWLQNKYF